MIENLYKAKKVSDGTWVEGQLLISHTGSCWIVVLYDEILNVMEKYRVDEGTLCRWTGHKDKNDKKIFENDTCIYNGSFVTIKYGKYYNKDCNCDVTGWYYIWHYIRDISKGYTQEFRFENLNIEVIDDVYDKGKLRVGSTVYILDSLLLDGSIEIVEAKVREIGDNGKLVIQSVNTETRWILYQDSLNRVVFRTREEAEKALNQEEKVNV